MNRMLKVSEAAKILNTHKSYLYKAIKDGDVPHIHIGGTIRIPEDALNDWIKAQLAKNVAVTA